MTKTRSIKHDGERLVQRKEVEALVRRLLDRIVPTLTDHELRLTALEPQTTSPDVPTETPA